MTHIYRKSGILLIVLIKVFHIDKNGNLIEKNNIVEAVINWSYVILM